jgi:hypothetical protein
MRIKPNGFSHTLSSTTTLLLMHRFDGEATPHMLIFGAQHNEKETPYHAILVSLTSGFSGKVEASSAHRLHLLTSEKWGLPLPASFLTQLSYTYHNKTDIKNTVSNVDLEWLTTQRDSQKSEFIEILSKANLYDCCGDVYNYSIEDNQRCFTRFVLEMACYLDMIDDFQGTNNTVERWEQAQISENLTYALSLNETLQLRG